MVRMKSGTGAALGPGKGLRPRKSAAIGDIVRGFLWRTRDITAKNRIEIEQKVKSK